MKDFTQEQTETLSSFVAPDRFSLGQSNRELHLRDISPHQGALPAGVIWPATTEEVSKILTWTYAQGIPVTPWGAGTSTEGNPIPTQGGLVMDMTRMDSVLAIRPDDLQADVQPGVFRKELNRQTGKHAWPFLPSRSRSGHHHWRHDRQQRIWCSDRQVRRYKKIIPLTHSLDKPEKIYDNPTCHLLS